MVTYITIMLTTLLDILKRTENREARGEINPFTNDEISLSVNETSLASRSRPTASAGWSLLSILSQCPVVYKTVTLLDILKISVFLHAEFAEHAEEFYV